MTTDDVRERLAAIKAVAHDYERAHGMEDELWADVLRAFAEAEANGSEVARLALTSRDIKFERYCA